MDMSGVSSAYTRYITDQVDTKAERMKSDLEKHNYSNSTDEELLDACKEFESYFLEQIFKEMEKTVDVFSEEEHDPNNTLVDYFKENTLQELAETSTEREGLGLAQMLFEQMKRNYEA